MGYKVRVSRMVEYDELTKNERIRFASTTRDEKLQSLLSEDELPEVRAALVGNLAVSDFFIYEKLINDPSEEVKRALRTLYENKYLNHKHWMIYKFSMTLFGKLPTFDKPKQCQSLSAFIYLSVIKGGNVGLDVDFCRVGAYCPYSYSLNYCMRTTSNVHMVLPERIEALEYEFAEDVQQKMDDFWQTINKEKPNDIPLEKWISSIARVHFKIHSINSKAFKNGDKIDQLAYQFVVQHFKKDE